LKTILELCDPAKEGRWEMSTAFVNSKEKRGDSGRGKQPGKERVGRPRLIMTVMAESILLEM